MPPRSSKRSTSPEVPKGGHNVNRAIGFHSNAILVLSVFIICFSLGISLWVMKLSLMQRGTWYLQQYMTVKMLYLEEENQNLRQQLADLTREVQAPKAAALPSAATSTQP